MAIDALYLICPKSALVTSVVLVFRFPKIVSLDIVMPFFVFLNLTPPILIDGLLILKPTYAPFFTIISDSPMEHK